MKKQFVKIINIFSVFKIKNKYMIDKSLTKLMLKIVYT